MKIKEQTRKLASGCSKHCFEVVDETDEVVSKHRFEVADRTDEVSNITLYGKATLTWFEVLECFPNQNLCKVTLTWFEEIFESINLVFRFGSYTRVIKKKRGLSYDSND
ncbi:chlorohydrolase [Streptococcus pneumoniae]|nr:chlorohydrolase [Streptococcus pneumoniae]